MIFEDTLGFDPLFDEFPANWFVPVTILPYAGFVMPAGCTNHFQSCRWCQEKTCQVEKPDKKGVMELFENV